MTSGLPRRSCLPADSRRRRPSGDERGSHVDREDIHAWIAARAPISGSLFLTHGEAGVMEVLRRDLQSQDSAASIVTPEIGKVYALPAAAPAKRLATGRSDIADAVSQDWQNDYARFTTGLKRALSDLESASQRREALTRMRALLDSFKAHRHERKAGSGRRLNPTPGAEKRAYQCRGLSTHRPRRFQEHENRWPFGSPSFSGEMSREQHTPTRRKFDFAAAEERRRA